MEEDSRFFMWWLVLGLVFGHCNRVGYVLFSYFYLVIINKGFAIFFV